MRTTFVTILRSAVISWRRAELAGKLRSAQLRSSVWLALPGVPCAPVGRLHVAPVLRFAALPRAEDLPDEPLVGSQRGRSGAEKIDRVATSVAAADADQPSRATKRRR